MSVILITGASSGIGRALALVYASHQHALLLTGRDEMALNKVAEQCREYGVKVDIVVQDLSLPDAAQSLFKWIESQGFVVDMLINNAGLGCHQTFSKTPIESLNQMLRVNMESLVLLTHLLLPSMLARQQGAIVNIGSVYSFMPVNSQVVYAATKAFVKSFSLGLSAELKGSGVSVSCICPGSTQTAFHERAGVGTKAKRFTLSADVLAKMIYKKVQNKKKLYIPAWYNRFFILLVKLIPTIYLSSVVNFFVYRLRLKNKGCQK